MSSSDAIQFRSPNAVASDGQAASENTSVTNANEVASRGAFSSEDDTPWHESIWRDVGAWIEKSDEQACQRVRLALACVTQFAGGSDGWLSGLNPIDLALQSRDIPSAVHDCVAHSEVFVERTSAKMERTYRWWRSGWRRTKLMRVCMGVLRQQAYLLDPRYLCHRSAIIVAREALLSPEDWGRMARCSTHSALDESLRCCAREALGDVLSESAEALAAGVFESRLSGRVAGEWDGRASSAAYAFLGPLFGLRDHSTLSAAVRFNGLHEWARHAFRVLVLEQRSVEACFELGYGPAERLRIEIHRCMRALLNLEELWSPDSAHQSPGSGHAGFGRFGGQN